MSGFWDYKWWERMLVLPMIVGHEDEWSNWTAGKKDQYIRSALTDGVTRVLVGEKGTIEQTVREYITAAERDESFEEWVNLNSGYPPMLSKAKSELNQCVNIIRNAEQNYELAMSQLNNSRFEYAQRQVVAEIVQSIIPVTPLPVDDPNDTGNYFPAYNSASLFDFKAIMGWVKGNPLKTAGIAGAGILALLWLTNKSNNTEVPHKTKVTTLK